MAKLTEVHNIVFQTLIDKPETRGDDYLLVYEVLTHYGMKYFEIDFVCKEHMRLGLPSLESITRCRRKIQHDFPELSGKEMRKIRKKEEKEFKHYALNHK